VVEHGQIVCLRAYGQVHLEPAHAADHGDAVLDQLREQTVHGSADPDVEEPH
jgi:hypothetical protein